MSPNISDWILASIQMEDPSLYQELCQLLSERKKKIEQRVKKKDFIMEYYNYLKSLHLIFVITWFAGLFYIVRLFVYQIEANEKPSPTNPKIPPRKAAATISSPLLVGLADKG